MCYPLQTADQNIEFPSGGNLQIPLANGNIMKIPLTSINISEEVNKTGIWKTVNEGNVNGPKRKNSNKSRLVSVKFRKTAIFKLSEVIRMNL